MLTPEQFITKTEKFKHEVRRIADKHSDRLNTLFANPAGAIAPLFYNGKDAKLYYNLRVPIDIYSEVEEAFFKHFGS
ncbi:hypothetical protein [Hymenobacter baengnokdamensis]|uniref:hypothetical protein n=1 Tax=Hymenobacter baengnokdamensis TaxID=2615203 RepID=UPI0012444385|nr:hypothetical protein [Hymenobacter baengnokdamensis]